jgi:hypothetical protein
MSNGYYPVCPLMSTPSQSANCRANCALFKNDECTVNLIAQALISLANNQLNRQSDKPHSSTQKPDGK